MEQCESIMKQRGVWAKNRIGLVTQLRTEKIVPVERTLVTPDRRNVF